MSDSASSTLSMADLSQIDLICDEFEAQWKSGTAPELESFVARLPTNSGSIGLLELVVMEVYYRHKTNSGLGPNNPISDEAAPANSETRDATETTTWADYVQRFPVLADVAIPPEFLAPKKSSIGDRFQILGPRATGGLGRVSVARDLQIGRDVAIKEMRSRFASQHEYRQRFLHEAEITGRLEHPFIVPVYAMGNHENGEPWYVMRLIHGQSMLEAIEDCDHRAGLTMKKRQLLQRLIDVCHAVEYAHSQQVIHRDIKPENIMLGEYGETFLVDWGLAKILGSPDSFNPAATGGAIQTESQTRIGAILGTPAYMSPEQSAGANEQVDKRSDIFNLGATLHHLITGSPVNHDPAKARHTPETNQSGLLHQGFESIPKPFLAICNKALETEPDDRYESAKAFATDIEMALADQPVSVFDAPLGTRIRRWVQLHRAVSGAVIAAVCLAFVGLIVFSWLTSRHANEVVLKNDQLDKMFRQETRLRAEAEQSEQRTTDAMGYLVGALRSPDPNLDGRAVKVIDILDQAVAQLDHDFANDPLMLANMSKAIGRTYQGLAQFEQSKQLSEKAHAIFVAQLAGDHRLTLNAAAQLAAAYQSLGDPRSFALIADVVAASQKVLGDNDPDALEYRRIAAIFEMQTGNAALAIREFEALVPPYEQQFGSDSSKLISLMNDLANAHHADGRSAEAASISKKVYDQRRQQEGLASLLTITDGSNYAAHLMKAGGRESAGKLLDELLTAANNNLGETHFQTLIIMSQLGNYYVHQNDMQRAIPLLQKSLELSEKTYGSHHSRALVAANGLAVALLESGDTQNAAIQFESAYQASISTRGPNHPESLTIANNLASAYRINKDYDSAIELFQLTLAAQKQEQGEHHPNTIRSMLNLAATMQLASRAADSIPICQTAFQLATEHLGKDHGQAQTAQSLEAMAHLKLKDYQAAKSVLQAALESRTRTIPNHWLCYNTMSLLGEAMLGLNELDQAEPILLKSYENLLEQKPKMPTRAHVRIEQARQRVIQLYEAKNLPDQADRFRRAGDDDAQ